MITHHLTHTGFHAGLPMCGTDREATEREGHTFSHAPYSDLKDWGFKERLCPDCKAYYFED